VVQSKVSSSAKVLTDLLLLIVQSHVVDSYSFIRARSIAAYYESVLSTLFYRFSKLVGA
jgi:hypothetical protein